jgi:hypothetical protein
MERERKEDKEEDRKWQLNMEKERKEDKEEARRMREEDRLENKTFQKNIIDELKENNNSINELKVQVKEIQIKQDKMEKDINNIVEKNNLKR